MVKSTVEVNSPGLMAALTMGNLLKITSMEMEFISGLMAANTKANGKITKWRALVCSHGLTIEDMKVNISMIRKKVKVHSTGQMAESTKESG